MFFYHVYSSHMRLLSCHGFQGNTSTKLIWHQRKDHLHPQGKGQDTLAAPGAAAAGLPHALPAFAERPPWPGAAPAAVGVASGPAASVGAKPPGVLSVSGLPHPSSLPVSAVPAAPHRGIGNSSLPWWDGPPGTERADAEPERLDPLGHSLHSLSGQTQKAGQAS